MALTVFIVASSSLLLFYSAPRANLALPFAVNEAPASQRQLCLQPGCIKVAAFVMQTVNFTADPCDDFYQFACGTYLADQIIRPDGVDEDGELLSMRESATIYDQYEGVIDDAIQATLQQLLQDLNNGRQMATVDRNTIKFYKTCVSYLNEERTEDDADEVSTDFINKRVAQVIAPGVGFNFGRGNNGGGGRRGGGEGRRGTTKRTTTTAAVITTTKSSPLSNSSDSWKLEEILVRGLDFRNTSTAFFDIVVTRTSFDASKYTIYISSPISTFYFGDLSYYESEQNVGSTTTRRPGKGARTSRPIPTLEETWRAGYLRFLQNFASSVTSDGNYDDAVLRQLADFELRLAKITPPENESYIDYEMGKDDLANVTLDKMNKIAPAINWTFLLQLIGKRYGVAALTNASYLSSMQLIVYNVPYFRNLSVLLNNGQLLTSQEGRRVLQNYAILYALNPYFNEMSPTFSEYYSTLTSEDDDGDEAGEEETEEEDAKSLCLENAQKYFGEVLSRNFLKRFFTPNVKAIATKMAELARSQFLQKNLPEAARSWMAGDAAAMLARFETKARDLLFSLGHHERATNITKLEQRYADYGILTSNYLQTLAQLNNGTNKHMFKLLDSKEPPPRIEDWSMLPTEVDAQYDPATNVVYVPAANFIEPFFGIDYPKAYNWGNIGWTLTHEFIHAFDPSDLIYDANGQYVALPQSFTNRLEPVKQCFINQYNQFQPVPKMHLNGTMTLDENVADIAGLNLAYNAFVADVGKDAVTAVEQPISGAGLAASGVTNEQLFFIAAAMTSCSKETFSSLSSSIATDEHSTDRERVIGSIMNSEAFGTAFKCPAGSKMNPVKKCKIW